MPDLHAALHTGLAGSYAIERELGRGGMARVFLARDIKHDRLVALKVLDPELAMSIGAERFLREIRVAARLQHPHILTIHDSGEIPGTGQHPTLLWFSMPYVEGETLRERLNREAQLPLADAVTIARETADALAYAHAHGVIHRDIKPENLLLTAGHIMVADFGVARAVGDEAQQLTGTGITMGTPEYMSPEQAAAGHVDGRSDIYALGCVLYEMLAGEPPYTGPTPMLVVARAMSEPYRPLRSVRQTVPPALDRVASIALARSPADRYSTAAEMARALQPEILTPARGTLPIHQKPRRRWVVSAGAGAVVLLVAAAFALLSRRGSRAGPVDPDLIAVAPFDLVSTTPELGVWSEGIVDVVARYFDGAGTLRAVAPTRAIRAWNGRADRESARGFGQRLAAGYVVYGQLVGTDSVRLSATLYDVAAATPLDEYEWRGTSRGIDRLADSLSTRFLDVLGRTRQVGTRRADPIGSSNPMAIREFLSGMRDLRRAAYGEAAEHFVESVRQDTGFVLGRLYGKQALGWLHSAGDTTAIRFSLEAAARNRGLTRRDSLLVLADSIDAAIYEGTIRPPFQLMSRLGVVMDTLLASNPDDPEVVYWVMDENHHQNPLGRRERWHLEGFKHAIELDPLFAPAYEHAIELSAMLDPPEATRVLIRAMLAIPGIDNLRAQGLQLADRLLDSTISLEAKQAALDSAPEQVLRRARAFTQPAPDSLGIMASRTLVRRFPRDPQATSNLMRIVLYHGRLKEAAALLATSTTRPGHLQVARELASLGVIPLATFDSLYDASAIDPGPFGRLLGVPLWIAAHDTARLQRLHDHYQLRLKEAPPQQRANLALAVEFIGATIPLARGDSSWFRDPSHRKRREVPPGMRAETPFGLFPVEMALAMNAEDDAWTLLQSRGPEGPSGILWMLYRARLAEKRGEREMAIDDYGYVARLWADADEPLRSFAREARDGLARLSAEP